MPKFKLRSPSDPYLKYLDLRQYGSKCYGVQDKIHKRLGEDMLKSGTWNRTGNEQNQYYEHMENPFYIKSKYTRTPDGVGAFIREEVPVSSPGGIYNLEFNSDGKILAAACEKHNILIFDPLLRKQIASIDEAHTDCVNCIRFLDSRTFASCSDDTSIALWDVRNLKYKVRNLRGHSNWVKNIEYNHRDNLLVTSGFDGAIFTWDINKYSENESVYKRIFYTNGLMRMRLTNDCSKMVISTMNGYLVVIHDLDIEMLGQDLAGFKPNVYRLMQISSKPIEMAVNYTHLFHAKRNRVEIISDFPDGNDAEVMSSLRLHPQGWVAVTRNTSSDERSEWCTVHDIQTLNTSPDDDLPIPQHAAPLMYSRTSRSSLSPPVPSFEEIENDPNAQRYRAGNIEIISTGMREETGPRPVITIDLNIRRRARRLRENDDDDDSNEDSERTGDDLDGLGIEIESTDERDVERVEEVSVDGQRFVSANNLSALEMFGNVLGNGGVTQPEASTENGEANGEADRTEQRPSRNVIVVGANGAANGSSRGRPRLLYFGTPAGHRAEQQRIPKDAKIHLNVPRLTHYIEESNQGKGFIKELSFSPDGRFIASPFAHGVRLLAFSDKCSDLSDCAPEESSPVQLYEVGAKYSHNETVLATAFSPCHWMMVTGCLSGRISWHQPVV